MATHSSILAWRITWTEKLGGLQSMRSQRVGHDLETKEQQLCIKHCIKGLEISFNTHTHTHTHTSYSSYPILIWQKWKLRSRAEVTHPELIEKWYFFVGTTPHWGPCEKYNSLHLVGAQQMVLEMNTPHDSNLVSLGAYSGECRPEYPTQMFVKWKTWIMPVTARLSFRWCNERAERSPWIPRNRNH